ncbi:MAG: site-specific integrase [Clostridia bacterium]|nr:site-specific integrase [Clostridia bacterium]
MDTKSSVDNFNQPMYTEAELERVAKIAAQTAIQQILHAPPNLENQIVESEICSSNKEGELNMYRESYSYIDEQGNPQTIRFNGRNKKDTDGKFQEFLCRPKEKKPVPTITEFIDTTYRKSFINKLAATTKSNYERYLQLYILPFMGEKPMDELTLATIQEFYDWLANASSHGAKQDINEKSIDRIGGLLSRILSIATEMKIISESPFKAKLLSNNGKPSGHHKALPDKEVDRVKKEVPLLKDEQQRLYMGFLIYTGLRREEILGLGWEHINLKEGYGTVQRVAVYPDNNRPIIKDNPKTKHSERSFIIPQPLLDILLPVENKTGFIIHGEDCSRAIAMSSFGKLYRRAFEILGIKGFNNHDWRTTFGTQMKESGLTSAQVADLMGHADTRMVETVYARTRHEGVMKHKNTLELLNQEYIRGNSVAQKNTV